MAQGRTLGALIVAKQFRWDADSFRLGKHPHLRKRPRQLKSNYKQKRTARRQDKKFGFDPIVRAAPALGHRRPYTRRPTRHDMKGQDP